MDPVKITTNPVTDTARSILYDELCQAMVDGLKASALAYDSAQDSAEFILSHLDSIKTYPELVMFLDELSSKWPSYKAVQFLIKEIETKVGDEALMHRVLTELQTIK